MRFDGIKLLEGSDIQNLVVDSGENFPLTPDVGELFYKNSNTDEGLYIFDGSTWVKIADSNTIFEILGYVPVNKSGDTMTGSLSVPDLNIDDVGMVSGSTITTINTQQNQVVDEFSVNQFRSAKYQIQVTSGATYQSTEVYLIHDGSMVHMSEIKTMSTGNNLASFDSDIAESKVRLLVTPTNAVTTIKVLRFCIKT